MRLLISIPCLLCLLTSLSACSKETPPDDAPRETSTPHTPQPATQPEAASPPQDEDLPPALMKVPEMPEGMLYIGYFFDNPGGDANAPVLDEPLVRVAPADVVKTLPAYIFDDEMPEHIGPPVELSSVEMQKAYPMGEAAIIGKFGDEADMMGRRANMSCHVGVYSHGASRCCMVPPSKAVGDTPFEARTADMLWAVVCLTNNVIQ